MPIKFFDNFIRLAAPTQLSLPGVSKPRAPKLDNNIFKDLETPAHQFDVAKPQTNAVEDGIRGAQFHTNADGTLVGVAKGDSNSFLKEPLVHHIGEHISPGLIPRTVIRNYPNAQTGKVTPHSLQQFHAGATAHELDYPDQVKLENHPHTAALRAFDWMTGNQDRHAGNLLFNPMEPDPKKQVGAIDNGGAFDYHDKNRGDRSLDKMKYMRASFPEDFRQGILNADENHLSDLFDRVKSHPAHKTPKNFPFGDDHEDTDVYAKSNNGFLSGNFYPGHPDKAKTDFLHRLGIMKEAMSEEHDDRVENPEDLAYYIQHHPRYQNPKYSENGYSNPQFRS